MSVHRPWWSANDGSGKGVVSSFVILGKEKKRISKNRWKEWNDGIKDNLSKPAFKEVWDEIKDKAPTTFTALDLLEKGELKIDPEKWYIRLRLVTCCKGWRKKNAPTLSSPFG